MNWSPQRSLGSCDHSITKSLDWNLFRNLWLDLNKNKLCFKVYFATYNKVSVLRLQSNTYLLTSDLREMNIAQIIYFTFHNIRQSFQRNSCYVWLSLSKSIFFPFLQQTLKVFFLKYHDDLAFSNKFDIWTIRLWSWTVNILFTII